MIGIELEHGFEKVLGCRQLPVPDGSVLDAEMYRTFNMGLGLVAIVAAGDEQATHAALRERGLESWTVGGIERGEGEATCEVLP